MTEEFVKYPRANHSLTAGLQLSVYVSVSARLPTTWGQRLCMLGGCIGYSRQSIHVGWIERVNIRPKYDHDHESTNVLWFYLVCDIYIYVWYVFMLVSEGTCVWPTVRVWKSEDHLRCGFLPSTLFETGHLCLFTTVCDRDSPISSYLAVGALEWRCEPWDWGRNIGIEVGALGWR